MSLLPFRLRASGLVILGLAIPGCGGTEQPRASTALLTGIPVLPRSAPVTTAAGSDAVQAAFRTEVRPDSVAGWYRRWLLDDGWRTTGDAPGPDGSVTLHAEKNGRPIWIVIQPAGSGTMFALIGAEPDSSVRRGSTN